MPSPIWTVVRYLLLRARARAGAAARGHPESGAITLEWIVIAGILVVAAIAAGVFFTGAITKYEAKIP
jgi:heme/copper-type cytochrome/quinol oxidase subunit 2